MPSFYSSLLENMCLPIYHASSCHMLSKYIYFVLITWCVSQQQLADSILKGSYQINIHLILFSVPVFVVLAHLERIVEQFQGILLLILYLDAITLLYRMFFMITLQTNNSDMLYRKCNTSCWWSMRTNCQKRNILEFTHCLEMTRYMVVWNCFES